MSLKFVKSSFCEPRCCVEVATLSNGDVTVRDSKLGEDSPVLGFGRSNWAMMRAMAKADKLSYDALSRDAYVIGRIRLTMLPDGMVSISSDTHVECQLKFDHDEWEAFIKGFMNDEF